MLNVLYIVIGIDRHVRTRLDVYFSSQNILVKWEKCFVKYAYLTIELLFYINHVK